MRKKRSHWFASMGLSGLLVGGIVGAASARESDRIGVQDGQLVHADSGEAFLPYGANYCRLYNGYHSVFNVGWYNPGTFDAMLADLAANKMNIVRIFIDHRPEKPDGGIATDGPELSEKFMENVLDGLRRARNHGVHVVICFNGLPIGRWYRQQFAEPVPEVGNGDLPADNPNCQHGNLQFLHPGAVRAKAEYVRRFVDFIRTKEAALLPTVFSYELNNEAYFLAIEPFNLTSGTFDFQGRSYDLSSTRALRRLADDASVYWANACADAIHSVDSNALVSANVFTYQAVGRRNLLRIRPGQGAEWDREQRIPVSLKALADSRLDYLDLHVYLHRIGESSVAEKMEETLSSVDFTGLVEAAASAGKPLIMGEFAAFKDKTRSPAQQADDVRQQIILGWEKGFKGFMYWTYDTDEQPKIWNLKMDDGRMLRALMQWRGKNIPDRYDTHLNPDYSPSAPGAMPFNTGAEKFTRSNLPVARSPQP